jgi:glycosyltransferase 2 family protein
MRAGWARFRVPGWVRVAVSAGLILALVWMVDLRAVGAALAGADIWWVILLLCAVYGERVYSAFRWHQVLRWSGVRVPLATVIRISFVSSFAGLFLPGVVGTEAMRVLGLARHSASLSQAFSSVLVDRLIAIVTLAPLVLVGVALAPAELPAAIRIIAWSALGVVGVMVWGMLAQRPRRVVETLCPAGLWRVMQPRLERVYAALDAYRGHPGMLAWGLALGLGFQFLRVIVVWASARAVGIDVAGAYFFIFAPLIAFVSMVPVSLAGIGIRDASYIYLFGLVGAGAEPAFAASILVQFTGLLSCLPGGILYARGSRAPSVREEGGAVVMQDAQEVRLCAHS